jgi:hypothetical protein
VHPDQTNEQRAPYEAPQRSGYDERAQTDRLRAASPLRPWHDHEGCEL